MTSDEYEVDYNYNFTHFNVDFSNYVRKPDHVSDEMYEAMVAMDDPPVSGAPWAPRNKEQFDELVESRLTFRFADEVAQQKMREIKIGVMPHPFLQPFAQMLEKDYPEEVLTIGMLWPRGGNVLLAATAKTGKSTLVANLIRSLCDGDDFLGNSEFFTHAIPAGRTLALLDLEMNERRVRSELEAQNIQNIDKLRVAVLRGQSQSFDITNDDQRKAWIEYLQANNVHTLIIDPIAPLLAQLNVDENDNFGVAQLFNMLDKVKAEAGVVDMMVVHHCGKNITAGWSPRGASRFMDWPDALWMLKKDGDDQNDPNAPRLMKAIGRDVGLPTPGSLQLDASKRLTFAEVEAGPAQDQGALRDRIMEGVRAGIHGANPLWDYVTNPDNGDPFQIGSVNTIIARLAELDGSSPRTGTSFLELTKHTSPTNRKLWNTVNGACPQRNGCVTCEDNGL